MPEITPDLLVDDVMRQWPGTIRVFLDFKFMCVGCPIACFHSVEDACREHKAELDAFLQALNAITLEAALASHNA
jgi:hybrid cluster-associated redox disulfide protein